VLDGSDNFTTRYMINDACVLLGKPLVYGAVLRFEGQVAVFNVADKHGTKTNYRDWFPQPPNPGEVVSCSEAGVLGVVPGIIGTMQATEVIKIITGIGTPLHNTVLTYNALNNTFYQIALRANPNTQVPATPEEFSAFNYSWFCNVTNDVPTVHADEFTRMLQHDNILVIDVREPDEQPRISAFGSINIPLRSLQTNAPTVSEQQTVIVFCQTGVRSATAVHLLQQQFPTTKVYSLRGGIQQWLQTQQEL
jgi:adenylyltransferase/sulfurtransferase